MSLNFEILKRHTVSQIRRKSQNLAQLIFIVAFLSACDRGPSPTGSSLGGSQLLNAPTGLTGIADDGGVSLSWTPPAITAGIELTDYVIQYSTDVGQTWATLNDGVSTLSSTIVSGLVNRKSYIFKVAAVNAVGIGSYSDESSVLVPTPWEHGKLVSLSAQNMTSFGDFTGEGVTSDSKGNIIVTGTFYNPRVDSAADMIVTKYNKAGTIIWSKQLGGSSGLEVVGEDVATDSSDSVYVVGSTNGSIEGNAVTGLRDLVLVKYDSRGERQWIKLLGKAGHIVDPRPQFNLNGLSISVDPFSNVVVSGSFYSRESNSLFLAKFSSSGDLSWIITPQIDFYQFSSGSVIDALGNIYITGKALSESYGVTCPYLIKFNKDGGLLWSKELDDGSSSTSLAVDKTGGIVLAVHGKPLITGALSEIYLAKYTSSGDLEWRKTVNHHAETTGSGATGVRASVDSVSIDANGNIFIIGNTPAENAYQSDTIMYLRKYDSFAIEQWTRQIAATPMLIGDKTVISSSTNPPLEGSITISSAGLLVSPNGSSFVLGNVWNRSHGSLVDDMVFAPASFDGNILKRSKDVFIAKYDESGIKQ
jgi:hypothetical protein